MLSGIYDTSRSINKHMELLIVCLIGIMYYYKQKAHFLQILMKSNLFAVVSVSGKQMSYTYYYYYNGQESIVVHQLSHLLHE